MNQKPIINNCGFKLLTIGSTQISCCVLAIDQNSNMNTFIKEYWLCKENLQEEDDELERCPCYGFNYKKGTLRSSIYEFRI